MSTPFTTPAGQTWQVLLTELTTAYSERRQAISQSAYTPELRNVQSSAYWRTLQGWLELNCTSFIDHVNGPLNLAGTGFLYFTLETWRAAAGLNADGFRRSPLAGGIAYGRMQEGDAINAPIFEDLQKGFAALRWSIESVTMIWNDKNSLVKSPAWDNSEAAGTVAQAGSENEFPSLAWQKGSHYSYHHQAGYDMGSDIYGHEYGCECAANARNYWDWNNFRSKVKYQFAGINIPRQIYVYVSPGGGMVAGIQTSFNDLDNVFSGWNGAGVYLLQTFPETASAVVCSRLWIEKGTPSVMLGLDCIFPNPWPLGIGRHPYWGGVMGRWSWGASANLAGGLSKWNFTNA